MNVLHTECGLNWGGQEYRTLIEAKWLNQHGHQSWIACDPRGELFKRGTAQSGPMVPVSMRSNADFKGISRLRRFCREQKIDILHTHGPKDSWMCFPLHLMGVPVVRSRHITVPIKSGIQHSFIYRNGCRRVIATAAIIKETLVNVNKLDPNRVDVVGEGVSLEEYNPQIDKMMFRKEWNVSADAPCIGIIAMMRGDKGHHFFLDAAFEVLKTHPGAHFFMIGEGIGGKRVERELRDRIQAVNEKRVMMTGYRWDIPQVIAALDIVVIASIEVEAQSRIAPQTFACKKALIATNVGGIPELVTDGMNGLLVPPSDPKAMAEAVRKLLDDAGLRKKIADAGYQTAKERLSIEKMMEATLAVYHKAIGGEIPRLRSG
jgi:glycosyltransferase involved in cell wall biosynthesis